MTATFHWWSRTSVSLSSSGVFPECRTESKRCWEQMSGEHSPVPLPLLLLLCSRLAKYAGELPLIHMGGSPSQLVESAAWISHLDSSNQCCAILCYLVLDLFNWTWFFTMLACSTQKHELLLVPPSIIINFSCNTHMYHVCVWINVRTPSVSEKEVILEIDSFAKRKSLRARGREDGRVCPASIAVRTAPLIYAAAPCLVSHPHRSALPRFSSAPRHLNRRPLASLRRFLALAPSSPRRFLARPWMRRRTLWRRRSWRRTPWR
jgi:hypothetical protein